jgi:hypothetical protein
LIEIDDTINSEYVTENLTSSKNWIFHFLILKNNTLNNKNLLLIVFHQEMDFSKLFNYLKFFTTIESVNQILINLSYNVNWDDINFDNFSCIFSNTGQQILGNFLDDICSGLVISLPSHWGFPRQYLINQNYYFFKNINQNYGNYEYWCSEQPSLDEYELKLLFIFNK